MQSPNRIHALCLALLLASTTTLAAGDHSRSGKLLTSGLLGSVGATIGPDGGLYVAEGAVGQISRVSLANGTKRIFASGLPSQIIPLGGPIDVAFHGDTAYALVTLVGDPLFGAPGVDGIYRIEPDGSYTIIADLGAFSAANPPPPGFEYGLVNGLQFAIEAVGDGFLVTDGHLNRVLHVGLGGAIKVLRQFGNVAPAGLARHRGTVYMAEVGAVPHAPATGRIEAFSCFSDPRVVAAGVPMIVDVAIGPRGVLYALSQGDWGGGNPGDPATPQTGRLLRVERDGTFDALVEGLDRPSSLLFDGNRAIVVTLTGDVWRFPLPASGK